jgi:hypothetical protein
VSFLVDGLYGVPQEWQYFNGRGNDLVNRILAILLFCICAPAQSTRPARIVAQNVITSTYDPAARIGVPGKAHYLGADRWVLYGMADCELHAFVDANPEKLVQRLYWVQFESYIPTRPELHHTYDSPKHATLGGMDFYVDSWVRRKNEENRAGSDVEHIMGLIAKNGYHMPEAMMYVRLVHLLDDQKRKELMIIYGEDIAPYGFAAAALQPGGKAHDRWPAMADGLLQRAKQNVNIE